MISIGDVKDADISTFIFQDAVTQKEWSYSFKRLVNTRNDDINNQGSK
jgi:hypothetical protein